MRRHTRSPLGKAHLTRLPDARCGFAESPTLLNQHSRQCAVLVDHPAPPRPMVPPVPGRSRRLHPCPSQAPAIPRACAPDSGCSQRACLPGREHPTPRRLGRLGGKQIQGRLTVQSSLIAHVCVEYKQWKSDAYSHLTPGRFVYAAGMEDHNPLLESRLHFSKKCLSPCQQSARGVMSPRCHCLRRGALRLSRFTWTRVNSMDSRCAERPSRAKTPRLN